MSSKAIRRVAQPGAVDDRTLPRTDADAERRRRPRDPNFDCPKSSFVARTIDDVIAEKNPAVDVSPPPVAVEITDDEVDNTAPATAFQ